MGTGTINWTMNRSVGLELEERNLTENVPRKLEYNELSSGKVSGHKSMCACTCVIESKIVNLCKNYL